MPGRKRRGRAGFGPLALIALIVTASVGPAAPAHALELFGHTIFEGSWFSGEAEDAGPDAQPYEIEFALAGGDEALADTLKGASRLYQDRDDVPTSTAGFLARGRGDYQRILAALYGEARYGGSIIITVNGTPIETIPADAELPDPSAVVVTIDPGPLFRFGAIGIANESPPLPPEDDLPPTPAEIGLVPGAPARSGVILKAEQALIGRWREAGHPKARIAERQTVANQDTATLDVAIMVAPGPPAVIGPVAVTGAARMNPAFVAWYSALERGKRFDPDDLETARNQMRRLEVFQSARIVEDAALTPTGELPLTIQVAERPLRVFGVGGSYSTLDGAGVEGYWQYRNLFGQAERLRFDARISGIDGDRAEEYDYYAAASFVKPGFRTPFTDLETTLFVEQENPDTFRERRFGGRMGLYHRFSEELEGRIAANIESIDTEDALGERDFVFLSLPTELVWDGRDDRLDPTKGWRLAGRAEPFYELNRDTTGLSSGLEASTYYAVDPEGRVVLAGRAEAGSIVGAEAEDLPASRLYFAGGGGSIRGYGYKNVGPRLPDGTVVGGRSLFEGSGELRIAATETIGIVPFVDFGNAFADTFPDFSEPLKVGVGIGGRYETGLGPLRLDFAVPLDPEADDPDYAIYVGLGEAF